jgi:hypothetical protein
MYLRAAFPPPAMFSAIEHGYLMPGNNFERMQRWKWWEGQGIIQGLPDMMLWATGRFVGIELKHGYNKLSEAQTTFGRNLRANGFEYIVCHSVGELDAKLRALGFPIPPAMKIAAMDHDAKLSIPEAEKKPARQIAKPAKFRVHSTKLRRINALRQRILF